MNVKNQILLAILIFLMFVFGVVVGINAPNKQIIYEINEIIDKILPLSTIINYREGTIITDSVKLRSILVFRVK